MLPVILAGGGALFFAAVMMLQRSLYVSALCLLAVLLQTAVIFCFLGSPLLAFLQIMIYAGAVMVLVVVAIMTAPPPLGALWSRLSIPWPIAVLGLLLPAAELLFLSTRSDVVSTTVPSSVSSLGLVLFGPYALATEAVGVLLMLAALAVVERRRQGDEAP